MAEYLGNLNFFIEQADSLKPAECACGRTNENACFHTMHFPHPILLNLLFADIFKRKTLIIYLDIELNLF